MRTVEGWTTKCFIFCRPKILVCRHVHFPSMTQPHIPIHPSTSLSMHLARIDYRIIPSGGLLPTVQVISWHKYISSNVYFHIDPELSRSYPAKRMSCFDCCYVRVFAYVQGYWITLTRRSSGHVASVCRYFIAKSVEKKRLFFSASPTATIPSAKNQHIPRPGEYYSSRGYPHPRT